MKPWKRAWGPGAADPQQGRLFPNLHSLLPVDAAFAFEHLKGIKDGLSTKRPLVSCPAPGLQALCLEGLPAPEIQGGPVNSHLGVTTLRVSRGQASTAIES